MNNDAILPFIKWPGGKRWLLNKHRKIFPSCYNIYYEPFFGGGAIFFGLKPAKAVLSDINSELINLYIVMRDHHKTLSELMRQHQDKHNKEYYYETREKEFDDPIEKAAQLLYLNRTCYNGMYRVNKAGKFNVPKGTKNNCIYDIELFPTYSNILKHTELHDWDFENTIQLAMDGDFIFADPPYTASTRNKGFLLYNEVVFTWDDQIRLHRSLNKAKERGARIIMTNADCMDIRRMYLESGFVIKTFVRDSSVAGKRSGRGVIQELVVMANMPVQE